LCSAERFAEGNRRKKIKKIKKIPELMLAA